MLEMKTNIFANSAEVDEVAHEPLHLELYSLPSCSLTHYILVDSSTVICWTGPFVILGSSDLFCCFYSIFDGKSC